MIHKISIKITQKADDCDDSPDSHQEAEISIEDAAAGPYYVIKSNRWAFEKKELFKILSILDSFYKKLSSEIKE